MQSLAWYLRRLQGMSATEMAWRFRSAVRDVVDRYRFALGLIPTPHIDGAEAPFRLSEIPLAAWMPPHAIADQIAWRDQLVKEADEIVQHRLSFFDLRRRYLGDPIDWNRDHASGKTAPMIYSPAIDYRDFRVTGDCKLVWEPNRHHQLVVLGRAYRVTGDLRYARAVVEQMVSWLSQNPFGIGMNWRSPLELGIRLINWVWAIDMIRDSGLFEGSFREQILHSVYLHCWEITRKYSRGSSANNHLVGESAGVYIASSYFPHMPGAERWRAESRAILLREIHAQTYADGCTREQALGYEFFVLQFYLFSGIVADNAGDDFPPEYWSRFEQMLEFIGRLSEGGGHLPLFGDCDDGYVLNLGDAQHDVQALLCVGAIRFGRSDFRVRAGRYHESADWLFGRTGRERFSRLSDTRQDEQLMSCCFTDSGYYLLQSGEFGTRRSISVLFDCGELGQGSIAAHGHADALSFTLRAFGKDVLVDPGTYDYFSFPEWRNYFRSTRAHNCLVVDDTDQSAMLGPFMWGVRAHSRCVRWQPGDDGGCVSGEHDGYRRLTDPVIHRRTLELQGNTGTLTIRDEIEAKNAHAIAVYYHLSELCSLVSMNQNRCEISVNGDHVVIELDPSLCVESLSGCEKPIGGWLSRGYHDRLPITTIVGRATCQGEKQFVTLVKIGLPHG